MKNKYTGEVIISILLIGLLICFIKPMDFFMPESLHPFMIPSLVVLFIVLVGLLWKETPGDEREQLHKLIASRFSYFGVVTVLIIGVIFQSFQGKIDPWLVIAICIMLIAKFLGLIYGNLKH